MSGRIKTFPMTLRKCKIHQANAREDSWRGVRLSRPKARRSIPLVDRMVFGACGCSKVHLQRSDCIEFTGVARPQQLLLGIDYLTPQSSNTTTSARLKTSSEAMQNPSFLATQRDSKKDSPWRARREMQRRRRNAPSCRGATDVPDNLPKTRFFKRRA